MLLILLAEQADKKDVWFSTTEFPARYRISHKTRAEGTAQLVARGLLETTSKPLSDRWNSSTFDRVRTRSIYRLTEDTFTNGAEEAEPGTGVVDDGIPKSADVVNMATGKIAVAQPPGGTRSGVKRRKSK